MNDESTHNSENQPQKVSINTEKKAPKTLLKEVSIWQMITWCTLSSCSYNFDDQGFIKDINRQSTIRKVELLDAPYSGGVTLNELDTLKKLR